MQFHIRIKGILGIQCLYTEKREFKVSKEF